MRALRTIVALSVVAVLAAPLAQAAPTCTDPLTRAACGGRVIAPPLQTATFLQYGLEYKAVLDALEAMAPGIIEVVNIGKSADIRDVYVVKITDESVAPDNKRQVALSLSVHGNESAGREGGLRYIEDLATWWNTDRNHALYSGDVSRPLAQVLAETEIYFGIVNVDGWADGDLPGSFARGNGTGADLNRDYPTIGWTKQNQLVQPETKAWVNLIGSLPRLTTASDIHGELTSANDAFADIMYPAGQWTPTQQAQELQFAQHMNDSIERQFETDGVILQQLFDTVGRDTTMKPANFATAFDVVGYDDSGFMGDWFVGQGAIELDVENFLSHMVPNNVWFGPLEQAHVSAVKGIVESVIVESMITNEVTPDLDLGSIGYVFDPARVERAASEGKAAYSASRMDYFADLAAEVTTPVVPLDPADVLATDLSVYDSIVVDDMVLPASATGVDKAAYVDALMDFAGAGGQLVLTDAAANLLAEAGTVPASAIKKSNYQGGKVDFGTRDHAWEADLKGVVNQTYYGVPLGYRSSSSIRESPNWGVTKATWDGLGGITVGTVDSGATVNLGQLPHGAGQIALFGSILPSQSLANRIDHGLADYAVTVTGGQVLHAILEYRRP